MYRRTLSNVAKALEMFAEARMYWMIFTRAKYTIRYQPCIRSFVVVGTINCLTFFLIICRDLLYFLHLVTASIILWENKFYRNNSSISINLYYTFRTSVRKDLEFSFKPILSKGRKHVYLYRGFLDKRSPVV